MRQRIGDTDIADAAKVGIQDETITYYLSLPLSVLRTAARCAGDLMARYAGLADVTVDHQLTRVSQLYDHYKDLRAELIKEAEIEEARGATSAVASYGSVLGYGYDDCRGPLDGACDYPYGRSC